MADITESASGPSRGLCLWPTVAPTVPRLQSSVRFRLESARTGKPCSTYVFIFFLIALFSSYRSYLFHLSGDVMNNPTGCPDVKHRFFIRILIFTYCILGRRRRVAGFRRAASRLRSSPRPRSCSRRRCAGTQPEWAQGRRG